MICCLWLCLVDSKIFFWSIVNHSYLCGVCRSWLRCVDIKVFFWSFADCSYLCVVLVDNALSDLSDCLSSCFILNNVPLMKGSVMSLFKLIDMSLEDCPEACSSDVSWWMSLMCEPVVFKSCSLILWHLLSWLDERPCSLRMMMFSVFSVWLDFTIHLSDNDDRDASRELFRWTLEFNKQFSLQSFTSKTTLNSVYDSLLILTSRMAVQNFLSLVISVVMPPKL